MPGAWDMEVCGTLTTDIDIGIDHLAEVEEIGRGGFSVVYSAQHTLFRRAVAVKVLHKLAREADRRRFERECEVMARLSGHPNVVTVHHAGYTRADQPYLMMELITGGTLAASLARRRRYPWPEAVRLIIPVCEAVGQAHSEQILHRDIKPENILLDGQIPKLTDFGIAYLRDSTGASSTHITASLLHTAPETFENRRDERSDLYSLASTLYTLVAGRPPFWHPDDESLSPLMLRLVTQPPPPVEGDVPGQLNGLLHRCLTKNPDGRPQTAAELGQDLAGLLTSARASASTVSTGAAADAPAPPAPGPGSAPAQAPGSSGGLGPPTRGSATTLAAPAAAAQQPTPPRPDAAAASPASSARPDPSVSSDGGLRPRRLATRLAWLTLVIAVLGVLANWDLYLDEARWSNRTGMYDLTSGFFLWFALPVVVLVVAALAVLVTGSRGERAASLLVGVILGALYYAYATRIGLRGLLLSNTNHYSLLGWADWLAVLAGTTAFTIWSGTWLGARRSGGRPGSRRPLLLLVGSATIILLGGLTTALTDIQPIGELSIDLTALSLLFAGLLTLAAITFRSPLVGAIGAGAAALSLGVAEWQLSFRVLNLARTDGLGLGTTVQAIGFGLFSLTCAYLIARPQAVPRDRQPSSH